jgi:TetR/AcrR family transcriptional regulator, mexCD-oprJ operon repressor
MHLMRIGSTTRLRTPAAILETAAHVLADHGDASMGDIAAAAGVGRATLYRYFPTREALLEALAAEATQEILARITDAGLDRAPVPEALQRLLRAFLTVGDRYVVLFRERAKPHGPPGDQQEAERRQLVGAPIQALFQRGLDNGTLRDDLGAEALARLFGGLVLAAVEAALPRTLGVEQTAASLASLFLDGARRHP